ncbi:CDP-alcohol phosphatidyltransferase family protein [Sinorhizobium meliloti]|uniref:CDP-alcohol phosphatidyltransferase family protein n=1 Tax=Rhizobium meliloti TaxID=382 RepID=UPI001296D162|nr:CDP-alcohol phosphatidyltransferase family protein [Sinorhizobium meliloti]MQW40800.1 hypothetical protein [Sinorhizobium meliloti]
MLIHLRDYANGITAIGYVFATTGLFLALNGHLELGTASMLWMWFLDHWDGHVARKTHDRRRPGAAEFGKCFDGFGDFIHGVLFPATVITLVGQGSALSLASVIFLVLAGAIRLSYFETAGLTNDGKFRGIPISYDTPILALMLVASSYVPEEIFRTALSVMFILLAALHITTAIQVPAIRGKAVPVFTALAMLLSGVLAFPTMFRAGF